MPDTGYKILRCAECGVFDEAPRSVCRKCGSARVEEKTAGGTGTLFSWTVIRKPPTAFLDLGIYAVAVVRLSEGSLASGRLDRFEPPPILGAKVRICDVVNGVPIFTEIAS